MKIVDSARDWHKNTRMSQGFSRINRCLRISFVPNPLSQSAAVFLWGPRQTGKTTLLKQLFPEAEFYDLLKSDLSARLSISPKDLREEVLAKKPELIVLDEIQKVPKLLEEVHWLLENTNAKFVLCGSSARRLKRQAKNLLGGRAINYELFPLTSSEIGELDLNKALKHGLLPTHYLLENPDELLKAYVNNYIKEEVIDEALTRNIPAFARFLEVAAMSNGQQINYANIARDTGVSPSTVRSYYQILKDTLLGFELSPWRKKASRKLIESAKFYFFDVGIANFLNPELKTPTPGTDAYGLAFEHFLLNEVRAFLSYNRLNYPISYWKTTSGFEVDLIIGNMELALEFKSSAKLRNQDFKGLRALTKEFSVRRSIIVSREPESKMTEDNIETINWSTFCAMLWKRQIIT